MRLSWVFAAAVLLVLATGVRCKRKFDGDFEFAEEVSDQKQQYVSSTYINFLVASSPRASLPVAAPSPSPLLPHSVPFSVSSSRLFCEDDRRRQVDTPVSFSFRNRVRNRRDDRCPFKRNSCVRRSEKLSIVLPRRLRNGAFADICISQSQNVE